MTSVESWSAASLLHILPSAAARRCVYPNRDTVLHTHLHAHVDANRVAQPLRDAYADRQPIENPVRLAIRQPQQRPGVGARRAEGLWRRSWAWTPPPPSLPLAPAPSLSFARPIPFSR